LLLPASLIRLKTKELRHLRDLLEVKGISKSFSGVQALCDVSFAVRTGEIHAIVGENGAGKSTLIKILAGIHRMDSGEIIMDGHRIEIARPRDSHRAGFRFIHQEILMVPWFTVAENILLGNEPTRGAVRRIDVNKMNSEAAAVIAKLGAELNPETPVSDLSVVQRQIVAVARSIATGGRVLVLDEATAPLSQREVEMLFAMLRHLKEQGFTIVYISHRLDEIFRLADRVTVLRDARYVGTFVTDETTPDELIRHMIGKDLKNRYPKVDTEPGSTILQVEGLTRRGAFEDISFTLHEGEILGIAGLVGAGRTEILRSVFGADPVDSGSVKVHGQETRCNSPQKATQAGLCLVPEDRREQGLVLNLSIGSNTCLCSLDRLARWGLLSSRSEMGLTAEYIRRLFIDATGPRQRVKYLSGGNQQKVVLAKWLARSAKVFLMDEPTKGVDVGAKAQIYSLMRTLAEEGAGLVLVSSDMPELLALCHRVLVIREGRIIGELAGEQLCMESVLSTLMRGVPS